MLYIPFKISMEQYESLESLLNTGKFEHEKFSLDLSPVQNISLSGGVMELSPPAKLEATAGPVNIKTTITEIKIKKRGGILINIDNSPVDVEISPNE